MRSFRPKSDSSTRALSRSGVWVEGGNVLEVISRHDGDTFRAVYTVRFRTVVYVLHAFQKKAKRGVATPESEIDLIKRRLRAAEQHYRQNHDGG